LDLLVLDGRLEHPQDAQLLGFLRAHGVLEVVADLLFEVAHLLRSIEGENTMPVPPAEVLRTGQLAQRRDGHRTSDLEVRLRSSCGTSSPRASWRRWPSSSSSP